MPALIALSQSADPWAWLWGPTVLILWVATVGVVTWLVTRTAHPREATYLEQARKILTRRYERGEFTEEEYRRRLDHLR